MRYVLLRGSGLVLVVIWVLLVLLTPAASSITLAQSGGAIAYGSTVHGTIAPETPLVLYSFSGSEGDLVQVDVIGLTGGLDPVVDLITPDRQTLATSQRNGLAADPRDAHIAAYLPQTGSYSLMLGGVNGTTGDFVLALEGRAPVSSTMLTFGQTVDVPLPQEVQPLYFTFDAESCPTMLTVFNQAAGEPFTFPFIVRVRDESGQEVALLRGGEAHEDRVIVEPLSGMYEIEAWMADPAVEGMISLLASCVDDAPACLSSSFGMAVAAMCPACPTCGDETLCADFRITVVPHDDGTVTVIWPEVEGAGYAIVSSTDETGALTYARLVEGETVHTIDYAGMGIVGGVQTIYVSVGTEGVGELCRATTTTEVELGPVDWGPPEGGEGGDGGEGEACTIHLIAPREAIANGLQTFFWSAVPGADTYRVHVSSNLDSLLLAGAVPSSSTSITLNVGEDVIGPGTEFFIRVFAMRGDDYWCVDGVIVERR